MTINADSPAMPVPDGKFQWIGGKGWQAMGDTGLSKREHFAAMAMQGLLSSFGNHDITDYSEIASDAVMAADALLKELNK